MKKGDLVKIKSWEQMRDEYGTDFNDINVPYLFTQEMRHLCDRYFIIEDILGEPYPQYPTLYRLKNLDGSSLSYNFSKETMNLVDYSIFPIPVF